MDSSAPHPKSRLPWGKEKSISVRPPPVLDSFLTESGITGADFTLPLFDGLSDDPKDYLIDLDTPSMERCPDVRVYFWMVGDEVQRVGQGNNRPPELDPPDDHQRRVLYDEELVKKGRQHLQESRAKGQGYAQLIRN